MTGLRFPRSRAAGRGKFAGPSPKTIGYEMG
jgi:hypothetical protein